MLYYLIVELISKSMTKYILQNVAFLRNTGLCISQNLDENGKEILRNARKNDKNAIIRNNKIIIDGK